MSVCVVSNDKTIPFIESTDSEGRYAGYCEVVKLVCTWALFMFRLACPSGLNQHTCLFPIKTTLILVPAFPPFLSFRTNPNPLKPF